MNSRTKRFITALLGLLMCVNTSFMPVMAEGEDTPVSTGEPVEEVLQEENTEPEDITVEEEPAETAEPASEEETPMPENPSATEEPAEADEPVIEEPVILPEETEPEDAELFASDSAFQKNNELVNLIKNGTHGTSNYYLSTDLDDKKEHHVSLQYYPETDKIYLTYTYLNKTSSSGLTSANVSYMYYLNQLSPVTLKVTEGISSTEVQSITGTVSNVPSYFTLDTDIQYDSVTTIPTSYNKTTAKSKLDIVYKDGTKAIETFLKTLGYSLYDLGFTGLKDIDEPGSGGSEEPVSDSIYQKNFSLVQLIKSAEKGTNNYFLSADLDDKQEHHVSLQYYPETEKIYLSYIYVNKSGTSGLNDLSVSYMYYLNRLTPAELNINGAVAGTTVHSFSGKISQPSASYNFDDSIIFDSVTTVPSTYDKAAAQSEMQEHYKNGTKIIEQFLKTLGYSMYDLGFTGLKDIDTWEPQADELPLVEKGSIGSSVTWETRGYDDLTLYIRGTGNMTNYTSFTDVPWRSNSRYKKIKHVIVEEGITSIGDRVFYRLINVTDFRLPSTLRSIGANSFPDLTSLTSLDIPEGVTTIGNSAFEGCSHLRTIKLPSTLKTTGYGVFEYCTSLEAVTLPAGLVTLNNYLFRGCTSLTKVEGINGSEIGMMTFKECYLLEELHITNKLKSVSGSAFSGCPDGMHIYYEGTPAQWEATDITSYGNEALSSAVMHYLIPLTGLKLTPASATINIGDTKRFTAVKEPAEAYQELVWTTSDSSVAAVDQMGNVSGISEGTAVITVKSEDGKFSSSSIVTVVPVHVTGITVTPDESSVNIGETIALNANISPSNATDKSYTWESLNPGIASVDQNGIVTGISRGTAVIQAVTTDGHFIGSASITVNVPVTGIRIEPSSLDLDIRDTYQLTAEIEPADANNKNVTWQSDNESIASVDENGVVTAVGDGTAVITAVSEDGGYTAQCSVSSHTVYAAGIHIEEGSSLDEIEFGRQGNFVIAFEPANTTNQQLIWTSSDETIATVDENGVITATGEGVVTITAASVDGGFTVSKEIKVSYIHLEGLSLKDSAVELLINRQLQLEPVFEPENASNKKVSWTSDNPAVVSVDENGIAAAHEKGSAVITGISEDGGFETKITVTALPEGIFIRGLDSSYEYTGSAIKPEFEVYDSGVRLENGKDYTVSYKNNTKAAEFYASKAPSVTVKMKGNYTGSQVVNFTIEPVSLDETNEAVTVDAFSVQTTGKKLTPVPAVYWKGKKLKNKTDYTVDYLGWDRISAGEYGILITGKGNFAGTRTIKLYAAPSGTVSLSKLKITSKNVPYTELTGDFRTDILSSVSILNKKTALEEGTDYEIDETSIKDCDKVGTCSFNIIGKNDFDGERTVTVKITGISISDKKVKVINSDVYTYTGEPIRLSENFSLKYNGADIDRTDYEIIEKSYKNNINAGTASVQIKGLNGYYGVRTIKFTILPDADAYTQDDAVIEDAYYTKGGSKPKVTIADLIEGTDYTVAYKNNKAIGIGAAVITGKGNYKGMKFSVPFSIERQAFTKMAVTAKDLVVSTKAGKYKSTPVIKDTDGKTLKAGTDYEKVVEYEEVTEDGTVIRTLGAKDTVTENSYVRVTVTGKNNYTNEKISVIYRILPAGYDISKLKITAVKKEYTGREVTLDPADLTFKSGKNIVELEYGKDYEITGYTNNVKKGTATVTIHGIGSYGGEKVLKFTITQRNIKTRWEGILEALGF